MSEKKKKQEPDAVDQLVDNIKEDVRLVIDDAYEEGINEGYEDMHASISEELRIFLEWLDNPKNDNLLMPEVRSKFHELSFVPDQSGKEKAST